MPPAATVSENTYFKLAIDQSIDPQRVIDIFHESVVLQFKKQDGLYFAIGYSTKETIRCFVKLYGNSVYAVTPSTFDTGEMTEKKQRLIAYCRRKRLL